MSYSRTFAVVCSAMLLFFTAISHSADFSEPDTPQSGRGLHYTCRMPEAGIVVTTESKVAHDPSARKADIFMEKSQYGPVDITDLETRPVAGGNHHLLFLEEVVVETLAADTRDWTLGASGTLEVKAQARRDLPENERMIQMVRVKTHPKTIRYAKNVFSRITGSELVVDAPVHLHYGVTGRVAAIEDNEVRVDFTPESDQPLDGPFGPVKVRDEGDHFTIETDAREDRLVRVGPAVGKIVEVNPKIFRIDYSHPFGGQTLTCDTRLAAIRIDQTTTRGPAGRMTANAEAGQTEFDRGDRSQKQAETRNLQATARKGDLATIAYTAYLKSGEIVRTTRSDFAENPDMKKIEGYRPQETFGPEAQVVGAEGSFFGLAETLEGMQIGMHKKVTVPAAQAFGNRNPQLLRQFDRTKVVPTQVTMPARKYVQQYGGFPVPDKIVQFNPYTTGRVVRVDEKGAVLELSPIDNEIESDFGLTRMKVADDKIHIHLTPTLGADFKLEKKHGKVVAVDNQRFMVDFNPPLAGEAIVVDVQMVALTKASRFAGLQIDWVENYEEGLMAAEKVNKPAVLVLYADWCGYSKKLFNTTLEDPRIRMMHDDFVWVKVDSHKERALKELYDQTGFPMTVVLDPRGDVIGTLKGYRDAAAYRLELQKALKHARGGSALKAGKAGDIKS